MSIDDSANVLDEAELAEEYEDDHELLSDLRDSFFESVPQLLTEIRQAIEHNDAAALANAAHTLKGSAGNFFAKAAFDVASGLEQMGQKGDLASASECDRLEDELNRLKQQLQQFLDKQAS